MEIDGLTEHRGIIKFLVKIGKTWLQINEMLSTVYGDSALTKADLLSGLGVSERVLKIAKMMRD